MMALLSITLGIIERGLIYSLIVAGMYISSRVIKFDDLSIEGSFGLGGAITAACLISGLPSWLTLFIALVAGAITGVATGLLHTRLRLNNLISGIIISTAFFSLSLKIGSSTALVPNERSLFAFMPSKLIILVPLILIVIIGLCRLLKSEIGFLLRAVGSNPQLLSSLGKSTKRYIIGGLALANALNALGGALLVHYTGYFSIWSSVGILIIGLTSLIISELMDKNFGINFIIGALVYQTLIALTFELNIDQEYNKLITAILLIILLSLRTNNQKN